MTLTGATLARGGIAAGLVAFALVAALRNIAMPRDVESKAASTSEFASVSRPAAPAVAVPSGFLYGRLTTIDGDVYQGRLRWGRDQEALWTDYFNGTKAGNPWAPYAAQREDTGAIEILGFRIGGGDHGLDLRRLFLTRFGDIARIETHFRDVQVTLKSGTAVTLDRFAAGDIDDGVRVWDATRGVIDVGTREIRVIEFLAAPAVAAVADRLHGTVRTRQGVFTGLMQWDQQASLAADELHARSTDGEVAVRYGTIRTIARRSRDTARVTRLDGHEMVLSGARAIGTSNRGIYVDDRRYGRVLISWDAFEQADFGPASAGPGYDDFSPGHRLAGTVITRDGRQLAGRLVYDFDESETTDTLDAAVPGVDFNIPFGLIRSIVPGGRDPQARPPQATVILHSGEALALDRTGDLGDRNAGVLIFVDGRERPETVSWADVVRIDFVDPSTSDP